MAACECKGCAAPGCYGSRLESCGWPLGKKKRAAMRCHWCTPGGEHSAPPCAAQAQKPDDPQDPSSPAACPLRPRDDQGLGLDAVTQHFNGSPPPLVFCYGGQHKEKFNGEHGEMINGFMMSAPGVSVWKSVWKHTAEMVRTYPERWRSCRKPGQSEEVVDDSLAHFTVPTGMTGREGVLCLGPLSMTKVMYKYLEQRGALNECMPKSFQNFWCWNSLTPKKKSWAQMQHHLFYRKAEDAAKHTHYSQLTTPSVLLSQG